MHSRIQASVVVCNFSWNGDAALPTVAASLRKFHAIHSQPGGFPIPVPTAQFSPVNADDFQGFHYLNEYTDMEEQNIHPSRGTVPNPRKRWRAKIKDDDNNDSLAGYETG